MPIEPDTGTLFGTQVAVRATVPRQQTAEAEPPPALGPNPLLAEADGLLALVPPLRATTQVNDLPRLREQIAVALQRFSERVRRRGIAASQVQRAHFVLGALLDHVVETMPWGAGRQWQRLNPLKSAPGESAGRYAIRQLARMAEDPTANRDLRELIFVALALGFEERAHSPVAGAWEGEQARARVAALLAREPGTAARPLSARWRPEVRRAGALASWLPLWVGSFTAAGLLALLYFSLALMLGSQSDRIFKQIAALRLASFAKATEALPPAQPRLLPLLSPVATQAGLQVRDEADRSVVTLRDEALFEAGTANLLHSASASLGPVSAALQRVVGRVVVIGHTDAGSERSARYPSNWELSVERARTVRDALVALGLPAARLSYDGRADTEAAAQAAAKEAPPHNGRIEIVLLAGR
ncbi:MAG TPA: type IVB secretion system protein IcmH/DotU [Burkholderiaceae bacterium]|jgi:type VI secretion system protein ImpK|nr:type IVB secretion system protein IcmH/DotU [Burkholderiaceae bacterium]